MRLIDADMLLTKARTFLEKAETNAYYTGSREVKADWDDAMRLIKEMPTASRWIPCSERLPDDRTEVIVSCHDDSGDTPFDYTSCGWMITDGEYWIVDNDINNFVVAWMPLPKPYKGE